jgi:hypothetical protein
LVPASFLDSVLGLQELLRLELQELLLPLLVLELPEPQLELPEPQLELLELERLEPRLEQGLLVLQLELLELPVLLALQGFLGLLVPLGQPALLRLLGQSLRQERPQLVLQGLLLLE